MDLESLISQDHHGLYCIMFKNKDALEEKEIEDLFSQFGKIQSIRSTGNKTGFRFVRYKNFHEAQKAIEQLKDHASINFLQPHNKHQEHKTLKYKGTFDNESTDKESDSYSTHEEKFDSFKHKGNFNSNKYKNMNKKKQDKKNSSNEFFNSNRSVSSCQMDNSDIKSESCNYNSFEKSLRNRNENLNGNKFDTTASKVVNSIDNEEIPDLVKSSKNLTIDFKKPKKTILNAEEIIVGNIHSNYGVPYILHLVDRYEPIAISNINVIPKTDIRYCHVYFKSVQDSMGVETDFDRMNLSGKKLVVLRPCRLMENGIH